MILNDPKQWDQEALMEVLSYRPAPRQPDDTQPRRPVAEPDAQCAQFADMVVANIPISSLCR